MVHDRIPREIGTRARGNGLRMQHTIMYRPQRIGLNYTAMNPVCHYSRPVALLHGLLWLVCLAATPCQADVLNISVKGVKEPMLGNVQSRVNTLAINDAQTRGKKRLQRVAAEAER